MKSSVESIWNAQDIRRLSLETLIDFFEKYSFGSMAVDSDARIAWIHEKYASFLGLKNPQAALGRPVEEVIPNSRMREVVETGRPIMLDIFPVQKQSLVVMRLPIKNEEGEVTGALAVALYEDIDRLKPLVSRFSELQAALEKTKTELAQLRRTRYSITNFVGTSSAALELKTRARRAAQLDTTVLLLGETGTGKEMLAQGIHAVSVRSAKPFVGINIAAIPETLLEAEIFGVAPGAYTGADRRGRDGKFKLADGGTLFLDEVGDMPMQVQAKLLRVLQEQEIEPLGTNKVTKVDVRVIAATSRNLVGLMEAGRFRSDLYYRLNVLPIVIPPLRERIGDIDALCEHLCEQIASRTGLPQRELSASARALLASHDWPGNVRELRNALEQAGMLSENRILSAEDFVGILPQGRKLRSVALPPAEPGPVQAGQTLADAVNDVERRLILATLEQTRGNKALAARKLGISRGKLYQKILQFNLPFID
ncbi:sigma 54-interacting transcriptional regulator [Janthinobacterium sp. 17J80-10]|uniref:sigma-54 interaction domain-containing protein n=1 Tax=Janthinobacterium sp. 17J80-10 TaxID=2497863 RepID=UPI0010054663|nr:sigma 54-interacting transcriptional regulator [Janthinobacterium sp. 17J80-10]QAU32700.1 AAA family ATPase [Janthinobacterium sp. 17J80-10]